MLTRSSNFLRPDFLFLLWLIPFASNSFAADGACPELSSRISSTAIALPKNVLITNENNPSSISYSESAPLRAVTLAPTSDGNAFLAWTDTDRSTHISKINASNGTLLSDQNVAGIVIRDMITVDDGVAILYFSGSNFGVRKIDATGKTIFDNAGQIVGTFSQIWHLGSLSLQGDKIAVYIGVSGNQGWNNGHEGDAFKLISSKTGQVVDGGWDWGCSHSIDNRIAWNGTKPIRLCLSDVYPSAGFNIDNAYSVQPTWGTHDGYAGGRIGGLVGMKDSLYFAFNKSPGSGYAETTEIIQLQNKAPFTKVHHYGLGSEANKGMKLAKVARLGTNTLLTGWAYADEKATVIQSLSEEIGSISKSVRIEGSLPLAHSDFKTTSTNDVIWAARDMQNSDHKLLLERVAACD